MLVSHFKGHVSMLFAPIPHSPLPPFPIPRDKLPLTRPAANLSREAGEVKAFRLAPIP